MVGWGRYSNLFIRSSHEINRNRQLRFEAGVRKLVGELDASAD